MCRRGHLSALETTLGFIYPPQVPRYSVLYQYLISHKNLECHYIHECQAC